MSAEERERIDLELIEEMLAVYEPYEEGRHGMEQRELLTTEELCRTMKPTLPGIDPSAVARLLHQKGCRLCLVGDEWHWELALL